MSLSDYKLTDADVAQNGVVAAPDKLTGTATQNKALFDRLIRETVKVLYNGLIDELSGNGGAEGVGVDAIEGLTAQDVQHALSELAAKLFSLDAADVGVDAQLSLIQPDNVSDALAQICDEFDSYQPALTFDAAPTAGSANPVTSGGIKTALDGKQDTLTFDAAPTAGSANPVTSGGVKTAISAQETGAVFVDYSHSEQNNSTEAQEAYDAAVAAVDEGKTVYTKIKDGSDYYYLRLTAILIGVPTGYLGKNLVFTCIDSDCNLISANIYFWVSGVNRYYTWTTVSKQSLFAAQSNGTLDMNSKKITSLAAPTANADAATKKYVDDAIAAAIASLGT